ncbi:MAG: ABC transporter ATP-binding protein, partial [Endomicrobium sp.]|nr:ABC transporter ATP-binding protein [Endomicrobium sp.]
MLEIKNLYGGYGQKDILKDINISIEKGSFCGLIGRNGAGKSALLKTICSLLKPSKGEILIDGQNTALLSKKDLAKRIAFMPQTLETSFDFTVREFLTFARFPYMGVFKIPSQKDYEAIDKILDFMGLKDFAKKSINELSGGERQKVSIAQIIAQDAGILIFDEPTAHLDIG